MGVIWVMNTKIILLQQNTAHAIRQDNIVWELFKVEALCDCVTEEMLMLAKEKIERLVLVVNNELGRADYAAEPPELLALVVLDILEGNEIIGEGLAYKFDHDDSLDTSSFVVHLLENKLDCDVFSFILLIVADEFNWDLELCISTGHVWVRLGERFLDLGNDEVSRNVHTVPRDQVDVISLSKQRDMLPAVFYFNRALEKSYHQNTQDPQGALDDLDIAITLCPAFSGASKLRKKIQSFIHVEAGMAFGRKREYHYALNELLYAVRLDQGNIDAWINLGSTFALLKGYNKALQAFVLAYQLDPEHKTTSRLYKNAYNTLYRVNLTVEQIRALLAIKLENGILHASNLDWWKVDES